MISSRAGLIVPAFRFCGMIVPFNADIISIRDVAVPYPDASGEKTGRDAARCRVRDSGSHFVHSPRRPHKPEAQVLLLRSFGIRPEGAGQNSPGQRPGNGNSREKQAVKGRNKGLAMLRPFRARADALQ